VIRFPDESRGPQPHGSVKTPEQEIANSRQAADTSSAMISAMSQAPDNARVFERFLKDSLPPPRSPVATTPIPGVSRQNLVSDGLASTAYRAGRLQIGRTHPFLIRPGRGPQHPLEDQWETRTMTTIHLSEVNRAYCP
jgi:hypothetical protein